MFKIQTWSRFFKRKTLGSEKKEIYGKTTILQVKSCTGLREFFPTLKKAKSDSTEFKRALAIANRCFEKYTSIEAEQELEDTTKKKYREPGAERKPTAPEVRQVEFQWFIDVYWCLYWRRYNYNKVLLALVLKHVFFYCVSLSLY